MTTSIKGRISAGLLATALSISVAAYAQAAYSIDLPAQALADSLRELGSQAHINVVFDPAVVKDREASALKGTYAPKQALARLLRGSGFTAKFTGANTVVIKRLRTPAGPARSSAAPSSSKETQDDKSEAEAPTLEPITVLGSLIPRTRIETASPLIVITAEDIKEHGFSSVADALQNLSINTGAMNNTSINRGDIWGVKTLSLFGLDPSYTKFLIDGRPMAQFSGPAAGASNFGGSTDQLFTNLSGIPIDLVERIEILPGGQSSLYGSDAIAGVVNIVMKKHTDFGTVDARYGWYPQGGGRERLLSASKSLEIGKLNLMVGGQVNDQQPMWALQRRITAQNFAGGINPQQASQDVAVTGFFSGISYFPTQPSDCGPLAGLWGGSERYHQNSVGAYCGSVKDSAYSTMINKQRGANLSVHADYAINDKVQLYTDLLDDYQEQVHEKDASFSQIIDDANLNDVVSITRNFAPEERASSLDGLLTEMGYENTYDVTLGAKVDFGADWNLDAGLTRSQEHNDDRVIGMLGTYARDVLGPQLGTDSLGYPVYAPDYSLLPVPLTPAQYAAYTGAGSIESSDRNDQLRAQLTQPSLFPLPGGHAGLAVVAEEGSESWSFQPSQLLTSGELQATSFLPSEGHATRYATAAELKLPLVKMLTADLSARYDNYDAEGARFGHVTYSMGLEFRPVQQLLLRGRYSTSFKAPTLIDQFEGGTKYQSAGTDYVNCARLGFTLAQAANCPVQYQSEPFTEAQISNPGLKPLTAKSLSYGVVWSPTAELSLNLDYQHTSISNEVLYESSDLLLQTELQCANGTLNPSSPTCEAVSAQITRAPATPGSPLLGNILSVTDTKVNIAHEVDNSIIAGANYGLGLGRYGFLEMNLTYTRVLDHRQQQFPGDPYIDFLNNPGFSTEFRTKTDAELTWSRGTWDVSLFGTYFGPTPNYIAQANNSYNLPYAGKVAGEWIYNGSIDYSPASAWQLSLRANNILNSMPPIDITSRGSTNMPFGAGNYNPYGRELFVEARYQFGRSAEQ